MADLEELVDFLLQTSKLKDIMRYSSCSREVQEPVAGHIYMVAMMVPIVSRKFNLNVNVQRAMEMALVHDLAESGLEKYDFDSLLMANGTLNKEDKDLGEETFMKGVQQSYVFGKKLYELWKEHELGITPEARLVRALDKIESHIYFIKKRGFGEPEEGYRHQALYADEAVRNFKGLEPFLRILKQKMKPIFEEREISWKKEYNYPD